MRINRPSLWGLIFVCLCFVLSICEGEAKPVKGETYRTIDNNLIIKIYSKDELEYKESSTPNIVAKYTIEEGDKLRVVIQFLGTTQVIYYKIIPEGLKAGDGSILYSKKNIKSAREKHYCSAIKSDLTKLATVQDSYFKERKRYIVEGDGSSLWRFRPSQGVIINLTGVPNRYYIAMSAHQYCPNAYIWNSTNGELRGPLSNEDATQIIEETRKKAEHEIKIARERAEREAKLAREKREREAKLAHEKAEREAKLAHEKAEREAKLAREKRERNSALIKAAIRGDAESTKMLLEKGVDMNTRNSAFSRAVRGTRASDRTVQRRYAEIAKMLLESGVDMNTRNQVFLEAAYANDTETVKMLLEKGVDINRQNYNRRTALMMAARYLNIDMLKALIAKGADINHSDGHYTALSLAIASGRGSGRANAKSKEIIQLLKAAGAK